MQTTLSLLFQFILESKDTVYIVKCKVPKRAVIHIKAETLTNQFMKIVKAVGITGS
jgi:hypothetical protein